ncbi:Na+/H+ antiporter NhaA [Actinomycetaceae bacterium MB13-C1-2]|nr:Na+/H+ antiporter NhaA [Actinomycetaceae bacterium MB13-C1-2]
MMPELEDTSSQQQVERIFPASVAQAEKTRVAVVLRKETVGGLILIIAAALAMIWANSPLSESYFAIRDFKIGYEPWHLKLSVGAWTADGLLAIFFFLVGLELKREFVTGDLRDFRTAIVPITAAFGGVIVPALIYTAMVAGHPNLARGWAIPTATDIAFAVAVLAIIGSRLPTSLRVFLLTLAVVDDLIAIAIIAIFYSGDISFIPLLISMVLIIFYGFITHRYREFFSARKFAPWLILLPIGAVAWAFMHASGVHATIAGVLLGLIVPVFSDPRQKDKKPGLAEEFEYRFRPLSTGVAVPLFALFAAGVPLGGWTGLVDSVTSPVAVAVVAALVLGKPIGIVLTTFVTTRITRTGLDPEYRWVDLIGVGILAGIGFTVSLLVTELSLTSGSPEADAAKVAVLTASVTAAVLASLILVPRNRHYKAVQNQGVAKD